VSEIGADKVKITDVVIVDIKVRDLVRVDAVKVAETKGIVVVKETSKNEAVDKYKTAKSS